MYVNLGIFKAYDIRGEYPSEINAKTAYIIARAFAEYLRGEFKEARPMRVVVSSDARQSSPDLKKGVMEGLLDEGVEVIDMSQSTSPFHYFAVVHEGADGGMMVTASHIPYRLNGFKFTKKDGEPIGSRGLEIIKNISKRGIFNKVVKRGTSLAHVPYREYIDFLFKQVDVSLAKNMHIVIDAGGGMAGSLLPHIVRRLPCKVTVLHGDVAFDMAHDPLNPMNEIHLADLKNAVVAHNADFGVAFDPDADRSGFVTHNARFFRADYMGVYIASSLLKKNPGAAVIYDVRSSGILRETVENAGGKAIVSRVGHTFIKSAMRENNAIFAAELSGHFYFKDFHSMDSDFLPMLYFLQLLAESGKSSDAILGEFEKYASSGEVNFKVVLREHLLEKIAAHFADAKAVSWLDGLSIYYDNWWANVRPSNTEPYVRLNVEARDRAVLNQKLEEFKKFLAET